MSDNIAGYLMAKTTEGEIVLINPLMKRVNMSNHLSGSYGTVAHIFEIYEKFLSGDIRRN